MFFLNPGSLLRCHTGFNHRLVGGSLLFALLKLQKHKTIILCACVRVRLHVSCRMQKGQGQTAGVHALLLPLDSGEGTQVIRLAV